MNYTKGEWKVDFTKVTGHCGISIDSPNRQVANVYLNEVNSAWQGHSIDRPENKEAKANAHLIAAAPDLYAALLYLFNQDGHKQLSELDWTLATNALTKAEGE